MNIYNLEKRNVWCQSWDSSCNFKNQLHGTPTKLDWNRKSIRIVNFLDRNWKSNSGAVKMW